MTSRWIQKYIQHDLVRSARYDIYSEYEGAIESNSRWAVYQVNPTWQYAGIIRIQVRNEELNLHVLRDRLGVHDAMVASSRRVNHGLPVGSSDRSMYACIMRTKESSTIGATVWPRYEANMHHNPDMHHNLTYDSWREYAFAKHRWSLSCWRAV